MMREVKGKQEPSARQDSRQSSDNGAAQNGSRTEGAPAFQGQNAQQMQMQTQYGAQCRDQGNVQPSTWSYGQGYGTYEQMMQTSPAMSNYQSSYPMQRQANASPMMSTPGTGVFMTGTEYNMSSMPGNRGMQPMGGQWTGFSPFGSTPGPFQSGFSTLPSNLRPSDQGHMFGGANRERSNSSEDNNGNANSAILSHQERVARNNGFRESLGHTMPDSFSAMTGSVVTEETETPRDEDPISETESSEQLEMFATMAQNCPLWMLERIRSGEALPLYEEMRTTACLQLIALAGTIA